MKRIKAIHVVEDLGVGGLEKVVFETARLLDREKYAVEVWCVWRGGAIADEIEKLGITVRCLGIKTYYNPLNVLKLAVLMKKAGPDIVHTHGYFAGTIGRAAAKLTAVPAIVAHVHSTYWGYSKRNLFIEKQLSAVTNRVICCSDAVRNFVVEHEGIKAEKAVTVYNGVGAKEGAGDSFKAREELGVRDSDVLVTTVGSLTPNKGQRYLIEAMSAVLESHRNVRCFIVGDGPLRVELENYSISLGIGAHVNFLGAVKDLSTVLDATDIFVMPTCGREGLGNAALEAMAYSRPVIASNIGGLPEAVMDGVTGYLVRPKDAMGISERINELIVDSDRRAAFGSAGRKIFEEKFSAERMVAEIEAIYAEILSAKKVQKKER